MQMQSNQPSPISTKRNLINQNFLPDYESSTSTRNFKQLQSNPIKSPPVSPRSISPLTQMMEIKNIKNDQFLFRMKLKFIACMQQLQITKEDIETLRKQESDSEILSSFINPVKKEFAELKKIKDQYLLKEGKGQSSMKSIKSFENIQIISLQNQIQQIQESEKKLKYRCQRLFTENSELVEKLKKKEQQFQESENSLYQTKLMLKEYESVIQNLKISAKRVEKDFVSEKQRLNEQINASKELMVRQREAKQIYLLKLDNLEMTLLEKQDTVKRLTDEVDFLKKQYIKWKNRSDWRENQTSQQHKLNQKKLQFLEEEIEKLTDTIKTKDSQISLAKKEASNATDVFNKKLEKIVEEWKTKLIDTIEDYEATIEEYSAKVTLMQKENFKLSEQVKEMNSLLVQNNQLSSQLYSIKQLQKSTNQKISSLETQLKDTSSFYSQKIKQLESIISQLKSQNLSKSVSIDKSMGSLSQLDIQIKQKNIQTQKLKEKIIAKQNEMAKVLEAKKETQNELLRRISTVENNRIVEISKLKVQNEEKLTELQNEINKLKSEIQKYEKDTKTSSKKQVHFNDLNLKEQSMFHSFAPTDSNLKSSIPSVNNSFNANLPCNSPNERQNRLISETYVQPQRKSSIRRVYVRSNSITVNEYLKEKMANNKASQETALYNSNQNAALKLNSEENRQV